MTEQGPGIPAGGARRGQDELAAPSACPEAGAAWDEWYARREADRPLGEWFNESPYDKMRRAFLAGWSARDAVERRQAADELAALTEELGLYDDGREP